MSEREDIIRDFLDFVGDAKVIERSSRHVVIQRDDMILYFQPYSTVGQFGTGCDIEIRDVDPEADTDE